MQKNHFNLDLPIIDVDFDSLLKTVRAFDSKTERSNWDEIKRPVDGCVVSLSHAKHTSHVGVYLDIDGGGVLHCVRGAGVIFSTMSNLKLSGWGRISLYEHITRH